MSELLNLLDKLSWDDTEVDSPAQWLLPDGSIALVSYHEDVVPLMPEGLNSVNDFMRLTGAIRIPGGERTTFNLECLSPEPTPEQRRYIGKVCREEGCWWTVEADGGHYKSGSSFTATPIWDAWRRCRVKSRSTLR